MKYYIQMHGKVIGPYHPEEITGMLPGISPDIPASAAAEFESGQPQWLKISSFPEMAGNFSRGPAADTRSGLALNILSTDDDSVIRELLWHMLTDAGHKIEFARDGEEVFKRIAVKTYDLLILDVNMPKMNGYKVSELIHDKLSKPPKVIIFTGRELEKERLQFVCSGADAILNKGTGNDKLIETIAKLFSGTEGPPAREPAPFTPEPQPPAIEDIPLDVQPVTLTREEFYSSPAQETLTPPAPQQAVPPPSLEIRGAVTAAQTCPPARHPAPAPENRGGQEIFFTRLFSGNKTLKDDTKDILRLLGHIELSYAQMEKHFETQALKILSENNKMAQTLVKELKAMKNYATLLILLLVVALLAAVILC